MKTILVPTDFSANATKAIEYAIMLAEQSDRKIIFLHSTFQFIPTSNSYTLYLKKVQAEREAKLKKLEKSVDKVYTTLKRKRDEHTTKLVVKFGPSIINHIVEMTHEQFIDLIIMGTHGSSGLKKVLMGSNTANIIEKVNCPVLAIPLQYKFKGIKTIAYATAKLSELKFELKKIVPTCQIFNATLEVFHLGSVKELNNWVENFDGNSFLSDLKSSLKYRNIRLQLLDVKNGSINAGIEKFVTNNKPDLLAMYTRKRSLFEKLFNGSKTSKMVSHLKVPLLAIK